MSKECKCIENLEVLAHVDEFGNAVASRLVHDFVPACPELVELAGLHAMARMIHVQVVHRHDDIEDNEKTMLDAVEKMAMEMAAKVASTLARILEESKQRENSGGNH